MTPKQSEKIFERIDLALNTNQIQLTNNLLDCYTVDKIQVKKMEIIMIFPTTQWNHVELLHFKQDQENQLILWDLFKNKFHINNAIDIKFHFKAGHNTYHLSCTYYIEERVEDLIKQEKIEELFI